MSVSFQKKTEGPLEMFDGFGAGSSDAIANETPQAIGQGR